MSKPRYNSRQITEHLREIAAMAHDWSEEDGSLTKGECLARLLWRKALGWTETIVDDEGNKKEKYHKPESWAIQLIYDRMEGKAVNAQPEEDDRRMKAKDQVSELARNRVNALAKESASAKEAVRNKPPTRKRKGQE